MAMVIRRACVDSVRVRRWRHWCWCWQWFPPHAENLSWWTDWSLVSITIVATPPAPTRFRPVWIVQCMALVVGRANTDVRVNNRFSQRGGERQTPLESAAWVGQEDLVGAQW